MADSKKEKEAVWIYCEYCGTSFFTESQLRYHYETEECSNRNTYTCEICGMEFNTNKDFKKHNASECVIHSMDYTHQEGNVPDIENVFSLLNQDMLQLEEAPKGSIHFPDEREKWILCEFCGLPFVDAVQIVDHMEDVHQEAIYQKFDQSQTKSVSYSCRTCNVTFANRGLLMRHRLRQHNLTGGADLQDIPWDDGNAPFQHFPNSGDVQEEYMIHRSYILTKHYSPAASLTHYYNFPLQQLEVNDNDIRRHMNYIFEQQQYSYRVNISAGVILQQFDLNNPNDGGGALRFFRPHNNAELLDSALYVRDRETLQTAIQSLIDIDINQKIMTYRPNTAWRVLMITNLMYFVYPVTRFNLGCTDVKLPTYLKKSHTVFTTSIRNRGKKVRNLKNLCVFVGLAQYYKRKKDAQSDLRGVKKEVSSLYLKWRKYCLENKVEKYCDQTLDNFKGIDLCDLHLIEKVFKVQIYVYHLNPDYSSYTYYVSKFPEYKDVVNFNIYENHLNFITDIEKYSKRYACDICDRMFKLVANMMRHRNLCNKKSKHVFEGGFYKQFKTVFEELEYYGIVVPSKDRYWEHIICWDLEAILSPLKAPEEEEVESLNGNVSKQRFINVHIPVSVAICSNVKPFDQPYAVVSDEPEKLVEAMFEHFYSIRDAIHELVTTKWGSYYDYLLEKIKGRLHTLCDNYLIEEDDDDTKISFHSFVKKDLYFLQLQKAAFKFKRYMECVPLCGFNSGNYDQNLIRSDILKYMSNLDKSTPNILRNYFEEGEDDEEEEEEGHIFIELNPLESEMQDTDRNKMQKQISKIMEPLISRASGGPLNIIKKARKYLSISNADFHFVDVMSYLAPHTSYSKFLSSFDIEEKKFYFPYQYIDSFEKLFETLPPYPSDAWHNDLKMCDLLDAEYQEWLKNPIGKRPNTGMENYNMIKAKYDSGQFQSLICHLIYYNIADVKPMVLACEKLLTNFKELKLDAFKNAISLPGLSRILMHRYAEEQNIIFPLFSQKDQDLAFCFRSQVAAGASIIFNRKQIVDETPLHPNSKIKCKKVLGMDFNSLYPECLSQNMPCYSYCRRKKDTGFYPQHDTFYSLMYVWLQQEARVHNVHIHTKISLGYEIAIGPYRCDGISISEDGHITVWELNGCYQHCHPICKAGKKNPNTSAYDNTLKKEATLRALGMTVISKWECDYRKEVKSSKWLREQQRKFVPEFMYSKHRKVTESEIIEAVKQDKVFGYLLCSVSCPSDEVYNKLKHFPPVFCNAYLDKTDSGPYTSQFIEDNNIIFNKPRRLLVGGLMAKSVLISTRLAAFYIRHGLRIHHIEELVEFCRSKVFEKFVKLGELNRRKYSMIPSKKMLANLWKILLNSSYGSCLLNVSTHTQIKVVDKGRIPFIINDPQFKSMEDLGNGKYEVELSPKKIVYNRSNIAIGFEILCISKEILSGFVLDWLDVYLNPCLYTVNLIDTDSCYISLGTNTMDEAVKPEMKKQYEQERRGHCKDMSFKPVLYRDCCIECTKYDSTVFGVNKLEFEGDTMICLSSKCYVAYCSVKNQVKLSLKGIMKSRYVNKYDPLKEFLKVLNTRQSQMSENMGFRMRGLHMTTYSQKKVALNFLYLKRCLLPPEGIYTEPVMKVLEPCPIYYICIITHCPQLDLDDTTLLFMHDILDANGKVQFRLQFNSIRQVYLYQKLYFHYCKNKRGSIMTDLWQKMHLVLNVTNAKELVLLDSEISQKLILSWNQMCNTHSILYKIITSRFDQHNIVLERILMKYPKHYPIYYNSNYGESSFSTGISAAVFRWCSQSYNSLGRNKVGEIYMGIRNCIMNNQSIIRTP